jgi:demethylmenaquinone methyltransferase/2-methoxy-6-polyprenyl-1,4-benzoquinol methylase
MPQTRDESHDEEDFMKRNFTLKMHDYIHRPEGKRMYNREMFGEIAPRYDFITRALSFGRDKAWKNELVQKLPELDKPKCLDLACGTGDLTFRLAERFPTGHIVGLDLTEPMLALAKRRNLFENVEFVMGDMSQTAFTDASFDIVTGGYALRNAPALRIALKEIRRVMKPGGTGAFLDFSKTSNQALQRLQLLVLKVWGGFWGVTLHRNPEVYTYIAASLKQFPDSARLKRHLEEVGFGNIRSQKHFLGMTETIIFEKI